MMTPHQRPAQSQPISRSCLCHSANQSASRPPRKRSRVRGVVLIIAMFAIILLAALLAYIVNLGRHVNARVITQNAADAAAISGAGWVAQSMNTVAMNNVTSAQYLATVNVLDGMPMVTQNALHQQSFLRDRLATHLNAGLNWPFAMQRLGNVVNPELGMLEQELTDEVNLLQPVHNYFQSNDIREITHFEAPSGRGRIWQALKGLEDFSLAVLESTGEIAQVNAVRAGQSNLSTERSQGDLTDNEYQIEIGRNLTGMIPPMPRIDYRWQGHPDASARTSFDDFERPVRQGLLPEWADDDVLVRGPFDTVFGWRNVQRAVVGWGPGGGGGGGPAPPQTPNNPDPGGVDDPFGGPTIGDLPNPNPNPPNAIMAPTHYATYGTLTNAINHIRNFVYRSRLHSGHPPNLRHSPFAGWTSQLAQTKSNFVWPQDGQTGYTDFAQPQWSAVYPSQVGVITPDENYPAQRPGEITAFSETAFFQINVKSRFPAGHSQFMASGSWAFDPTLRREIQDNQQSVARIHILRKNMARPENGFWWLPRKPAGPDYATDPHDLTTNYPGSNVVSLGGNAWLYSFSYEIYYDPDIGITVQYQPVDPDDPETTYVPVLQRAYYYQVLIWAGVNTTPIPGGRFNPTVERNRYLNRQPRVIEAIDDEDITPEIRNPFAGFDRNGGIDVPAPIELDRRGLTGGEANRRLQINEHRNNELTFLSVTRRSGRALMWPRAFDSTRDRHDLLAVSQATVFNNHSYDLWTQMWHAQLTEVFNNQTPDTPAFDFWITRYEDAADDAPLVDYLTPEEEMEDVVNILATLTPAARSMLQH